MSNSYDSVTADELAQFDDIYRDAEVEDRDRDREEVPDGNYQVNVERAEMTRARSTGRPMLKWTLRILGPTHAGRLLWRHNVLATPENVRWAKSDLAVCGIMLEPFSELPARVGELLDCKLEVAKRTRGDNTNIYINRRIVMDGPSGSGSGARVADALTPF